MPPDAAAKARQGAGEPRQPARLADLAHLLPFRVVAVLQPAGGIAPDRPADARPGPARKARPDRPAALPAAPVARPSPDHEEHRHRARCRTSPCRAGGAGSRARRSRHNAGRAASPASRRSPPRRCGAARASPDPARQRWQLDCSRHDRGRAPPRRQCRLVRVGSPAPGGLRRRRGSQRYAARSLGFSGAGRRPFPFSFSLADEGNGAPGGAGCVGERTRRTMTGSAARRCDGARPPVT